MSRPVVVTATPSLSDYVRDGVDCLTVPPRDPTAVTEAIERISRDEDLRVGLGQRGREVTETVFNCRTMWGTVANDIRDLVEHPG